MSRLPRSRRMLSCAVALLLAGGAGMPRPAVAGEEPTATLRGTIYLEDERTPAAGATAIAISVRTHQTLRSNTTGSNGVFEISDLPAGTYDLALEIGGKVYVAETLIDLPPGSKKTISFAALPGATPSREIPGVGAAGGVASVVRAGAGGASTKSGTRKFWTAAGWTAVAGALTAALLGGGGNGGEPVSPSQP